MAAGKTSTDILVEFPDFTSEKIAACLDYARGKLLVAEVNRIRMRE